MQNVPSKPEVMLRNDDLLIFAAAMAFLVTSLCRDEWELLPFVKRIEARNRTTPQGVRVSPRAGPGRTSAGGGAIIRLPLKNTMAGIHITDIEAAINYWREREPSPDGITLAKPLRALAEVYALMVYFREQEADEASMPGAALDAWLAWYATTPDTPCIAICSTSQGDPECKGCGRTFDEVQLWTEMTPAQKRQTWRRITLTGEAWRFNRYSERAVDGAAIEGAA
jgi:predicted Fe-S protein YdhL (DUF1289 family)